MTAVRALNAKDFSIKEEYIYAPFIVGKRREYVYEYLFIKGLTSFSEVTANVLADYIRKTQEDFRLNKTLFSSNKGNLEILYYSYEKGKANPLISQIFKILPETAVSRKVATFLMAQKINHVKEITAEVRKEYEEYLRLSVPTKVGEYLKALDLLKLQTIRTMKIARNPRFSNNMLFLGYYPDYEVAKRFYYTARKEFLFFDFSRPVSEKLKRQVFKILRSDLSNIYTRSNHYQIQQFITPLYFLYEYCCLQGITDIKRVSVTDEEGFSNYLSTAMDAKSKSAPQVLYRARKQLFLMDKTTDYAATAWFIERFNFSETRENKARGIDAFYFDYILDSSDKLLFQNYMKYLLVLSPKLSLQSILGKYTELKRFIQFLQKKGVSLNTCFYQDISDYIYLKTQSNIKPETLNKELSILSTFMNVIRVREGISVPVFPFEYYYAHTLNLHHDRTVSEEKINAILTVLPDISETVGLIFLTLYCTGLRINEVCLLRKDSIFLNNGIAMLKIYQQKMKSEKIIPIPEELFKQLKKHSKIVNCDSEYMFPGIKDPMGPYQAATFVKQMKKELLKYEMTSGIVFRSHDYRHTIATDIYKAGGKIGTIRAFLGHKRDDMTRQYIDYLSEEINKLQEEYFRKNALL